MTYKTDNCTTCRPEFPFRWETAASCHGQCPDGSYRSSNATCTTCPAPCRHCSDNATCTLCTARSSKPYLTATGLCTEACAPGTTAIDNKCVRCATPCATCALGQVHSCLSCDNAAGAWLRYGPSCYESCPVNTIANVTAGECLGCQLGCQLCDEQDNSRCLRCSAGLALLESACLDVCPPEYKKSEDGSVCELRSYPLDKTFVAFPILGTAMFFVLVTLASYWLTARRSLVASALIAFFGPIEMAATFYQFVYAGRSDRRFVPIEYGSICVFISGLALNFVFVVNFHKQVKGTDKEFERWRKQKSCASNTLLALAALPSLTLYRLIYCQLFRLDMLSVKVSRPQPFLRPILIFSWIKFAIFNVPLVIVDIYGIAVLEWGNQCFMTMVESCILSFCSLFLMIWETRNRTSLILKEDKSIGKHYEKNMMELELLEDEDQSST